MMKWNKFCGMNSFITNQNQEPHDVQPYRTVSAEIFTNSLIMNTQSVV